MKRSPDVGEVLAQQRGGGQRLLGRDVAAADQHGVGLDALIVARPVPDADALGAMLDGGVHVQVLEMVLLVGHDHVDVVAALQAMVDRREQGVDVRRQIDAGDLRILVDHDIQKARILMGETVVVLAPDGRGDQEVQRGDARPPGDVLADRQPLGVLVVHAVDDMDEGLVGREKAVSSGQDIALVPALQGVLGEHLEHASIRRELAAVGVLGLVVAEPEFLRDLVDRIELVRGVLVRAEHPEVVHVLCHDVAQQGAVGLVFMARIFPGSGT
jgi:hypothetical protein